MTRYTTSALGTRRLLKRMEALSARMAKDIAETERVLTEYRKKGILKSR